VLEVDTGEVVWYEQMEMYSSMVTAVCSGPGPEAKKRAEQARLRVKSKKRGVASSKPAAGGQWQGGQTALGKAVGAKPKPQV
jgi:hypothetical protein